MWSFRQSSPLESSKECIQLSEIVVESSSITYQKMLKKERINLIRKNFLPATY